MTAEIIQILFAWAVLLSPYPRAEDMTIPRIEPKPMEFFVENACGLDPDVIENLGKCNAVGWYNDTKIVYVDDRLRGPYLDEVLVHEFVHHLQYINGDLDTRACREKEARAASNMYRVRARGVLPKPPFFAVNCKK